MQPEAVPHPCPINTVSTFMSEWKLFEDEDSILSGTLGRTKSMGWIQHYYEL